MSVYSFLASPILKAIDTGGRQVSVRRASLLNAMSAALETNQPRRPPARPSRRPVGYRIPLIEADWLIRAPAPAGVGIHPFPTSPSECLELANDITQHEANLAVCMGNYSLCQQSGGCEDWWVLLNADCIAEQLEAIADASSTLATARGLGMCDPESDARTPPQS